MPILHWLDKESAVREASRCAYRLLEPVDELSYGDSSIENMLIQGNNLEALKALIPLYAGKVKCIFIDPPYNTKSTFEHYDDNLEHSHWLSLMYPRLELLRQLLSEDGSIWITIDYNEGHYLKIICDEIFGRNNFVQDLIWQHAIQSKGYPGKFSLHHNYIFVYRKSDRFKVNLFSRTDKNNINYSNPDNDPRGAWRAGDVRNSLVRKNLMYNIKTPSGKIINHPPKGWRFSEKKFLKELSEGKVIFSKDESRIIRKIYLADQKGRVPESIWFGENVGTTREANKELKALALGEIFSTPKPERLIESILTLCTKPGDLVLDSFAGSGTTGAAAHKMQRNWIMIELGEHCQTHVFTRMKKVINGEQGGISKSVNWQGGGGFRFYQLSEKIFDEFGVINKNICFETLAAHVWYLETRQPFFKKEKNSLIGVHQNIAYYLLYNGILGDKKPDGGNVLTLKIFSKLSSFNGKKIIYGEACRLGNLRLQQEGIIFKQIPYDLRKF